MKTDLKIGAFSILLVAAAFVPVQAPAQGFFADTFGGNGYEYAYSIQQTSDGGYVFTGPTDSSSAGLWDFWVVKLDPTGAVAWQKTYGGSSDDVPNCIKQTSDGGYIVAGRTQSLGVPGGMDAWVLKLDATGNRIWQKTFGGSGNYDAAYSVVQNGDGEYYIGGWTNSYGAGSYDYWVIKLDSSGNSLWQKAIGGSGADTAYSICISPEGGAVIAGGGNVVTGGNYDVWAVKLDPSGNIAWQKAFGGAGKDDIAFTIQPTSDGGYITAGFTYSYGAGERDLWILKLDSSGGLTWNKTYGGTSIDWAFGIQQAADGGYIVAGRTDSFPAGNTNALILKLDSSGNISWQRTFGSGGFEYAYCVSEAADGSYMVGGITGSFGAGSYDAFILKLESYCMLGGSCTYLQATSVSPGSPATTTTTTTKNATNTSCTSYTTAPSSTSWAPAKNVACAYPVLPPGDALTVTMTKTGDTPALNWNAPGGTCSITSYGIYRGTLPISSYDHSSLNCSVTDLFYLDSFAGEAQYYLVVPDNNYLEGSYGTDSSGNERPPGTSNCRPRCLLPCL